MLTTVMVILALTQFGVEAPEGSDEELRKMLDDKLAEVGLSVEQFITEESVFSMGYQRALAGISYRPAEQLPKLEDTEASKKLSVALQMGYGFGLSLKTIPRPPVAAVVFEAWKNSGLTWGNEVAWATALGEDVVKRGYRLAAALNVGSGKTSRVIPAGTPVELLAETIRDGVPHVIVGYDGLALVVPHPDSDPGIVPAANLVTAAPKVRAARTKKPTDPNKPAAVRHATGPTIRDVIIHVLEGLDGGPGPLQSNSEMAKRVMARATELGISDRAAQFFTNCEKHVPYYTGIYRPDPKNPAAAGRLGVRNPLTWVIAATEARKFFLRALAGGATEEAARKAIPAEFLARMEDHTKRLELVASERKAEPAAEPAASEPAAEPAASEPADKKKRSKKAAAETAQA